MSIDNFWNWIEQTHMVPVLWHRTNLDWKRHLFIVIQMESLHLFSLFSNKMHLLFKLAVLLKTEFFGAIKFGFIFLSDERAQSPFSDCHWVMLFLMAFFFFEYRLSNFIFTFLMNNCQIVKKWIHIYYKMFWSLSKGTPLNGISNPWQQALVGLGHCFGFVHCNNQFYQRLALITMKRISNNSVQ